MNGKKFRVRNPDEGEEDDDDEACLMEKTWAKQRLIDWGRSREEERKQLRWTNWEREKKMKED